MELPSTFHNEERVQYDVRVTVSIAQDFTHRHKIGLGGFRPDLLDFGQLLELAYAGTRWNSHAVAAASKNNPETFEKFMEGLEGPSCTSAQVAAVHALLNFTVRTLPKEKREAAEKKMPEIAKKIAEEFGSGAMSGVSAESQASPIPAK